MSAAAAAAAETGDEDGDKYVHRKADDAENEDGNDDDDDANIYGGGVTADGGAAHEGGGGGGGGVGRARSIEGKMLWLSLPFVAALLPGASQDTRRQAAMSINIALKVSVTYRGKQNYSDQKQYVYNIIYIYVYAMLKTERPIVVCLNFPNDQIKKKLERRERRNEVDKGREGGVTGLLYRCWKVQTTFPSHPLSVAAAAASAVFTCSHTRATSQRAKRSSACQSRPGQTRSSRWLSARGTWMTPSPPAVLLPLKMLWKTLARCVDHRGYRE